MEEKIKVLELFGEPFAVGGEETIVYDIFKNMDKKNIHIDFLAQYSGKNEMMRKNIIADGANFFAFHEQKDNYLGRVNFFRKVKRFLKKNDYDIVHIHSGSILGFILAIMATSDNKRYIIAHSHNTGIINWKKKMIKNIFTPVLLKANMFLGCTKEAIEFKFPQNVIKTGNFEIIKNGINYKQFIYNEKIRKEYRNILNIKPNIIALGFVGRLVEQKNPMFLVDVFENLLKRSSNIKLFIVGEGDLKQDLKHLIKEKGLCNYIIMLGNRNDVNKLMQAFDVLLFPSLFEGLGIVAVEAQAAGLPVIVSKGIPEAAKISDEFFYRINNYDSDKWGEKILEVIKNTKRRNTQNEIINSGYDIKFSASRIRDIYLKGVEYGKDKRK